MKDDLKVFRDLVLWLWQSHTKPGNYDNERAKLLFDEFGLAAEAINNADELEAYLPSEDKVDAAFPTHRYFYLAPITERLVMLPRIHLKCDFGRNIPEIRCRLELFLLNDDLDIQSLGYRFESPEGLNDHGAGIHHYYHIQMIQPPTSLVEIDWLPVTQPAFPINADDPVKLILILLVSLYGLDYLWKILRECNIWGLDDYIKGITCITFGTLEWYKLVEVGDPTRHIEPYNITSNVNDFVPYIKGKYPGCRVKGISRTRFDGFKDIEKKKYP